MKKIPGKGIIIALILLGILLFFNRRDIQLQGQDGLEIDTIGTSGYRLKSVIHLNNPNLLSSTINNITEKFYVDGLYVGELNNKLEQGIPGRRQTDLPVEIRFTADSNTAVFAALKAEHNHKIDIKGEINFHNLTGSGKITVDIKQANAQLK